MNALISLGLIPVGKVKDCPESQYKVVSNILPPEDKHNRVYLALIICGVGFLLPYNSFIIAVDYFHNFLPGTTIVFNISLIYILTSLIAVLLSNVIIFTFSLNSRIVYGYILSFLILLFIFISIIWLNLFTAEVSYAIILVGVALLSLGATGRLSKMLVTYF